MHKKDGQKKFYATIRKIDNINKVVCKIQLADELKGFDFHLSFHIHINQNK